MDGAPPPAGYHPYMDFPASGHPHDDRCDAATAAALRAQAPARKLATLDALWASAVEFVTAGVRAQHPSWGDAAVRVEVARRMACHGGAGDRR